ncbi:hypothetical protein BUE93_21355 [Chromobacterium amazonense]|uniref:Uncharacterized protein n=1 Tax=Chromobacterium amazonense TaxID=1382803 RepID=A0A2S9WYQ0_9NEIS|nr:hypothetical protein [Chromobacterium amazonense]PRP68591.1 hypothetical protein BUE93_21355 [Chromobacterium amazonense]
MQKILFIVGDKNSGKARVARVAAQIAEQHHGAHAQIVDAAQPEALKRALAQRVHAAGKTLLIVEKRPQDRTPIRASARINLDHFKRHPFGRALTFTIREAVDSCLVAN